MKKILPLLLLPVFLTSCGSNSKSGDKYIKLYEITEGEGKIYGYDGIGAIVIFLDAQKDEIIYFDLKKKVILDRVSIK